MSVSAFGVWRLAFGVWRLAFGVWRRFLARSASAMKWQYKIAQGFYEADRVKAALLKSIF